MENLIIGNTEIMVNDLRARGWEEDILSQLPALIEKLQVGSLICARGTKHSTREIRWIEKSYRLLPEESASRIRQKKGWTTCLIYVKAERGL